MKRLLLTTLVLLLVAAPALAQETDELVSRYDSQATQEMAAEYQAMLEEREVYLEENDTASWNTADETNALADARFRDIQDAPLPEEPAAQAEELREKADSLYALQEWADSSGSGININSDLYSITGPGAAKEAGDEYREMAANAEAEAAQPESDSGSDGGGEAASGGGDGGEVAQSGSDGGGSAEDTATGAMDSIGDGIMWFIAFLFTTAFVFVVALGVMFLMAWRREGDVSRAMLTTLHPARLGLALLVALIFALLPGWLWWLAIAGLVATFFVLRNREGSSGAAFEKMTSFVGGLRSIGGGPSQGSQGGHQPPPGPTVGGDGQDKGSYLDRYTRNVTQEARDGQIEEAIGRADELEALVETLTRRKVNNVVLTGEAGVGKTALVEELANKLVSGTVPPVLAGKELLELNVTAIGAIQSVGDLGERLGGVLDELKAEPDRYIIFVDEMHMLMGAGAHRDNPSGAADILKPALARGQVRMIGATTNDEFQEIEKDPAMARRFGKVDLPALPVAETVEVLRSAAPAEENHYNIRVEDEALEAVAKLADQYITDQQLPGSAVAVLQTACSGVAMRGGSTVTAEDVARVISRQTGVPVGGLSGDEKDRVKNIEAALKERMVGQDEAVKAVADAVRRKRSGFGKGRPASFGFFGVTGVGKTELAKALAEVLFGNEDAMVRLDMSEYANQHASWKLIGAAKGYQDSESGGTLTEPVRRKPYSVVLLDEIEKAHPETLDPLLSILDDGRVTDGQGRLVNFENTMVIMTSNLAADEVSAAWRRGEKLTEDEMGDALVERGLRPELVQRIGKVATFAPPEEEDVKEIARRMFRKTGESVQAEHGIEVSATDAAIEFLAAQGYDPINGLRPLRRVIERQVEDRLSDLIVDDKISRGDHIEFDVRDGEQGTEIGVRRAGSRSRQ